MRKTIAKCFGGLGGVLGVASALMWILSANAQKLGLDPAQLQLAGFWNMQSAQFNYFAATLTAFAAACSGVAVAVDI